MRAIGEKRTEQELAAGRHSCKLGPLSTRCGFAVELRDGAASLDKIRKPRELELVEQSGHRSSYASNI
jgi:hypothetical protein